MNSFLTIALAHEGTTSHETTKPILQSCPHSAFLHVQAFPPCLFLPDQNASQQYLFAPLFPKASVKKVTTVYSTILTYPTSHVSTISKTCKFGKDCSFKHLPKQTITSSEFSPIIQLLVHENLSLLKRLDAAEEKIQALESAVSSFQTCCQSKLFLCHPHQLNPAS